MRTWLTVLGITALLCAAALGCSKKKADSTSAADTPAGPLTIYTVNHPLHYFALRLAPGGTRVVFPAPQGTDPAFWKPTAEVIQNYQRADLILSNGAGYASWMRYATLPASRVVVTTDGCRDDFIQTEKSVQHQHGPEGAHAHAGLAFTTWLDLELAACQARRIRDALIAGRPNDEQAIADAFGGLRRELLRLDERLRRAGEALGGRSILASHPVYQYLADAYGLSIESLHLEPDQALAEDDWKALDAVRPRNPATIMLWEGPPLPGTEEGLQERGIEVVVFDPAGQMPTRGDFLSIMEGNVERLECAAGARTCD